MLQESEIKQQVFGLLREKLDRLGIRESELHHDFDLVKSGLMNSIEFVDLAATLENLNACEIDFEKALDQGDFTTLRGLTRAFTQKG